MVLLAGARIPSRTHLFGNPFERTAGARATQDRNPAASGDEIGISSQRASYDTLQVSALMTLCCVCYRVGQARLAGHRGRIVEGVCLVFRRTGGRRYILP